MRLFPWREMVASFFLGNGHRREHAPKNRETLAGKFADKGAGAPRLSTSANDRLETRSHTASLGGGRRRAMSGDFVPMTREAYNRLKSEIERLEMDEMPKIAQKIAEARAEGDLKENAEYHAQRENQGLLQAKINSLKSKLVNAHIVDPTTLPKDEVVFGATVRVLDLDFQDEEEYTLVGMGDEDYDCGKILTTSPIGAALLGAKVGQTVEVTVPRGKLRYKVQGIEFRDL
jgi:transcription elongation factor GreA